MEEKCKPLRICIDLSPQLNERLDEISLKHGLDKIDIIRRAFALFDIAVMASEKNERLGVVDQDGKFVQEVVGLI